MLIERKDGLVTEMLVHRDENSAFTNRPLKDFRIVRCLLARFGGA